MRRAALSLLIAISSVAFLRAQTMAVSTDIPMLATQTYNMGVEMTVSNRSTIGVSVLGNYHPYVHMLKDMRAIAIQPEWRYYFSGRPMLHHFVGICGLVGNYDITWKGRNHHGDAAGAGLTFGYVVPLGSRWNIDAHAGMGLIFCHEKREPVENRLLPTKIGVSLTYIIR